MSDGRTPVLWLYGPSGVGKTTVAWAVYSQLLREGVEACFVDIDQLGMCYPEPPNDPGRHRLQATNLNAVVAGFRWAGARCVVVSGVVDPGSGVPVDLVPAAELTACRLRADAAELSRRFSQRQGPDAPVDEVLAEAASMDGSGAWDSYVDTTGRSVGEVVRLVRERIGDWPVPLGQPGQVPRSSVAPPAAMAADGSILWLCGVTGVGKSTVGFQVYMRLLRAGRTAAYVDLDQLGLCDRLVTSHAEHHQVKARNLAALWQAYRSAGAESMVMVGPAENAAAVQVYTEALPAASINLCRLHAGPVELTRRIMSRGHGGSWAEPGDRLIGQSAAYLGWVADQAAVDAAALDRAAVGDVRIDTDGRSVDETADLIAAELGWPGVGRPDMRQQRPGGVA